MFAQEVETVFFVSFLVKLQPVFRARGSGALFFPLNSPAVFLCQSNSSVSSLVPRRTLSYCSHQDMFASEAVLQLYLCPSFPFRSPPSGIRAQVTLHACSLYVVVQTCVLCINMSYRNYANTSLFLCVVNNIITFNVK